MIILSTELVCDKEDVFLSPHRQSNHSSEFLKQIDNVITVIYTFKVTVQFERCFQLMEHISVIS